MLAGDEYLRERCAEPLVARVGVGERDVDQRAFVGERGAKFVGDVRRELTLGVECRLEAPEKRVERESELAQLVIGAAEGQAPVKVAGRDLLRGCGDRAQR